MRKLFFKSVITAVALCLALFGFVACSDSEDEKSDGKFQSVDPSTVLIQERVSGIVVSWEAVPLAGGYKLTCNGKSVVVNSRVVNLSQIQGLTLPADGKFQFSLVAQAYGYDDSDAIKFTYTAKGVTLESPKIESFTGGVLQWGSVAGAAAYKVTIDGKVVSGSGDGLYRATNIDLSSHATGSALKVEISAISGNATYFKDSTPTVVGVNAAQTKLMLLPVDEYEISDGVLTWAPVGGASAYRVVDINMTVVKTIKAGDTLGYDMAQNNLVIGVFPISDDAKIADAELSVMDIDYLDGEGTESSPYLIRTPFDLRAIDYYERKYAQELADGKNPSRNRYRIENDLNFNSVAALDSESNIYTLSQPFYGYLDGNFKKLSNARVEYDGGYWALFDYITAEATVRDITFDGTEINNKLQDFEAPLGASVSAVANKNYGTVRGIWLKDVRFSSVGGSVSGVCTYNYGTVTKCTVSGEFIEVAAKTLLGQDDFLPYNQACYEMAGVVLENYGTVSDNTVERLDIRGSECDNVSVWELDDWGNRVGAKEYGDPYNNVRCAAGIVAVNRSGGVVSGNGYGTVNLIRANGDYKNNEFGGIVAYNAGTVRYSASKLGTFTYSATGNVGAAVDSLKGSSGNYRGKVVGKSNGTVTAI